MPRAFTPATSAALDELELTQVLTTIARRPYQAVGVFATDPFDVVFLARQVRRYCPNVRLFTSCADLLLSRPGENIDLRGMLVASTYPLYPSNQWMTTPFRDAPRVFFGNRGCRVCITRPSRTSGKCGADEPETLDPSTPQLLEFGFPYDVRPENHREPPVWISVVGERGLYPVTFVSRKISRGYLYNPESSPEQRRLTAWPAEQPSSEQTHAASATRPMPHLLFWLVCLSLLIACLFVAGITRRYALWSSDPFKYERKSLTGVLGLGHVLRWLNCDVAERVPLRLILISDDAEAPANPANRHFLIVAHKLTDKLRFQVFDDKGGMVEEYDEKELLAASQSGKEGWLTGLRKRRLLNRLRNQLEPLWQRGSPNADLTKSVIDLLVKIAGDRFVPFAYVDPRTKKALDGKGYDPQHQFDKSQNAIHTASRGGREHRDHQFSGLWTVVVPLCTRHSRDV